MPPSRLVNRNIVADRGRTSMRLEPELWDALMEICERAGLTIGELVREVEKSSAAVNGRTSAMRVYALNYFREAATPAGHAAAGHRKGDGKRDAPTPSRQFAGGSSGS